MRTVSRSQRVRNLQVHHRTLSSVGFKKRQSNNLLLSTAAENTGSAPVPQNDGAAGVQNGSNLQEPEYNVNVKLSDLQADPNNPLYSVKNFSDLGLWVALDASS